MKVRFNNYTLSTDETNAVLDALDVFGRLLVCDFSGVSHILKVNFDGKLDDEQVSKIVDAFGAAHDAIHTKRSICYSIFDEKVPCIGLLAMTVEQQLLGNLAVAKELRLRINDERQPNYFVGFDPEKDGPG